MPRRWKKVWPLLLSLALLGACAPAPSPVPPAPRSLTLDSEVWNTPATRQSLAGGGLLWAHPFPGEGLAAVFTGKAPAALVSRPLALQPGGRYRLSLSVRRQNFVDEHYLWLNLWGVEHRLDAHCVVGGWQELVVEGRAPADGRGVIALRNHSASRLLVRRLALQPMAEPAALSPSPSWPGSPFPWGVYLDSPREMEAAAAAGFNLVLAGSPPQGVETLLKRAQGLGLRLILYTSPEPSSLGALIKVLGRLPANLRPLALYLVDEPEIRSYSLDRLLAARKILSSELPGVRLVTAMVRPRELARYAPVYDAVFMDQYPIPGQPLNWLADSIGLAKSMVRPGGQVWAVAQGFGGGQYTKMGWPRPPTPREARALCASALVAGAQGLLVYRWSDLAKDPALQKAFTSIARRLTLLQPWLPLTPGLPPGLALKHLGRVKSDPGGGPAVRTGWSQGPDGLLLLAVNTTAYDAEAALYGVKGPVRRLWPQGGEAAVGGELRFSLGSLGARAWVVPALPGAGAR